MSRFLGSVTSFSARRAPLVLALSLAATLVFGAGMLRLEFSNDFLEALPADEPNAVAARNVSREFPGFFNVFQVVFHVDEAKWAAANAKLPYRQTRADARNVTDEAYVRGMDEFHAFVSSRVPSAEAFYDLSYSYAVKAMMWANSGVPAAKRPDDAAYAMPGTDPAGAAQYAIAWATVLNTSYDDVRIVASPDWTAAQGSYPVVPKAGVTEDDLGRDLLAALEAYKAWVATEGEWDVFDHDGLAILVSNPAITAHSNALTIEDLSRLAPLVAIFIVLTLFITFRDVRAIAIAIVALGTSVVWTLGFMGWVGIAVNALNLTIVPLIMGVGIDYAIHVTNEYFEHTAEGVDAVEALRRAGDRSGVALFVSTVTTIGGLAIMAFSPSTLMAELGTSSSLSIGVVFALSMTLVPACLALLGRRRTPRPYRPDRVTPAIGAVISRRRGLVAAVVLLASAALYASSLNVGYEVFGNPVKNFVEDDPLRTSSETAARLAFGEAQSDYVSNFLILEGDMTDPAVHDFVRRVADGLRANPRVRPAGTQSIVGVVEAYLTLKDGTAGAPAYLAREAIAAKLPPPAAEPVGTYPRTSEEIRAALDDMYASPGMAPYVAMFANRDYSISIVTVDIQEGTTFADTQATWEALWGTIRAAGEPPDGLRVRVYGYTAFNYLFITHEMPWVSYMGIASSVLVLALVLVLMRDLRATIAIGAIMFATTVWWLGLLPLLGVGLAITLMLPMSFITSIGTDYAVHLAWSVRKIGDPWVVLGNVGKAVLASAVTTFGAFALFVPMRDLMMRKAMIATAVALLMILAATVAIFPLVYRVERPIAAAAATDRATAGVPEEELRA